jgi:hypothetical protein
MPDLGESKAVAVLDCTVAESDSDSLAEVDGLKRNDCLIDDDRFQLGHAHRGLETRVSICRSASGHLQE